MHTHCNKEIEIVKSILAFTTFKTAKQYFMFYGNSVVVLMYVCTSFFWACLCIMITVFIQLLHSLLYISHIKDINCIQLAPISIRPKIKLHVFPLTLATKNKITCVSANPTDQK